jgi:hypothetical protein
VAFEANSVENASNSFFSLGQCEEGQGNLKKSVEYFEKSLELAQKSKNTILKVESDDRREKLVCCIVKSILHIKVQC